MCVWICRDIQLTKRMQSITGFLTSKTKSLLVWRALFGFDGERKKKSASLQNVQMQSVMLLRPLRQRAAALR